MIEIETRDLWFSYTDDLPVLKSVSIQVQSGEFLALIGQNGSGKTTLAKHFLGLLRPSRGLVKIQENDIAPRAVGEIARTVGYVFQNPDHQIFSASVGEEISYGLKNLRLAETVIHRRTQQAMERFALEAYADMQPATMSYGIRRKVALASIYAMDPQILILDEPTGGLDWRSEQETMALLHELNEGGKTIVLITHDMRLVAEHAQRCLVLSEGRVVAHDETREIMKQSQALEITPPQIWQLSSALDIQSQPLTVSDFCAEYGRRLTAKSEINVGRS